MSIQMVYNPVTGLKNAYTRLQEGKIIHLENQKTKFD
jgi:hypothetical protein